MNIRKSILVLFVVLLSAGVLLTTIKTLERKSGTLGDPQSQALQEDTLETAKVLPSPDNSYTAFILGDQEQSLYIGQGKDFSSAQIVNTGLKHYTNISWAPDSRYLFAGSTDMNKGVLIRTIDLKPAISLVGYMSGPFWSPQGDKACFTVKNSIRKESGLAEETTDILVSDLDKEFTGVRFARGTLDYYYKVDSWEADGTIKFSKVSSRGNKIIEQLSCHFAHYLFSLDLESLGKKNLALIKDLKYEYFLPSPDGRWLSMVEPTLNAGEGKEGIPFFYNLQTGETLSLGEKYNTTNWDAHWFSDSARIMLNPGIVYNVLAGEKITYEFPEDLTLLAGRPSPNGSKIAVLACKKTADQAGEGEVFEIVIVNSETREIEKTIKTSLKPKSGKHGQPEPLGFTWADNQSLIVESWVQEDYSLASLWKININDGSIFKFSEAGRNPLLSPDGQRIASFAYKYSEEITPQINLNINSAAGTPLKTLNLTEYGLYSWGGKMLWDSSGEYILLTAYGYEEGVANKYLVKWAWQEGKPQKIKIDQAIDPLYLEEGKAVCINGSIY